MIVAAIKHLGPVAILALLVGAISYYGILKVADESKKAAIFESNSLQLEKTLTETQVKSKEAIVALAHHNAKTITALTQKESALKAQTEQIKTIEAEFSELQTENQKLREWASGRHGADVNRLLNRTKNSNGDGAGIYKNTNSRSLAGVVQSR